MRVTITGYQGEGRSLAARELARVLNKKLGCSVRVNDGPNSLRLSGKGEKVYGKRRPADVVISVRLKPEPGPAFPEADA